MMMECMDLSSCKQQVLFTTSSRKIAGFMWLLWWFILESTPHQQWQMKVLIRIPYKKYNPGGTKHVIILLMTGILGSLGGLFQSFEGAGCRRHQHPQSIEEKGTRPQNSQNSQSPKLTQIKWCPSFETQHAAFPCFTKIGGWKCLGRRISTFHYHQWTKGRRVAKRPTTCEEITWIISASPMTF